MASQIPEQAPDDTATAAGLPSVAYYSDAFMQLERDQLFSTTWHAIGFAHDIPTPGSVYPVMSAAGCALLLCRDQAGDIHVFHNYCRHRGMRLVDEVKTNCRKLVCPYHAWCYELDGTLSRVPHKHGYGKHDDAGDNLPGLARVRSEVWAGIVFVDLSGAAVDFDVHMAPLSRRWARYDFDELRHGRSFEFDVPGNWKLAIENFIDIYHVPYVHPALNKYNDMTDHYFVHDGIVLGQGNREVKPTDNGAHKLPEFRDLAAEARHTMEAICLFPNLLLTVFADNLRAILVEPTSATTCHERVSVWFVGDEAMTPALEHYRNVVADRFPVFNIEDVEVVRRLQRSFESSGFESAHFNPFFDVNVFEFQQLIAGYCTPAS